MNKKKSASLIMVAIIISVTALVVTAFTACGPDNVDESFETSVIEVTNENGDVIDTVTVPVIDGTVDPDIIITGNKPTTVHTNGTIKSTTATPTETTSATTTENTTKPTEATTATTNGTTATTTTTTTTTVAETTPAPVETTPAPTEPEPTATTPAETTPAPTEPEPATPNLHATADVGVWVNLADGGEEFYLNGVTVSRPYEGAVWAVADYDALTAEIDARYPDCMSFSTTITNVRDVRP